MKNFGKLIFIIACFILLTKICLASLEPKIYFFWGEGCPHCAKEKIFLEKLKEKYPEVKIEMFEVYYNKENAKFFNEMANAFGIKPMGVPTTFIDDKVWIGYADYIGKEIEKKVKYCIENNCSDPILRLKKPSNSVNLSKSPETTSPLNVVCVHVFYHSQKCPQCEEIMPYIDSLANKYVLNITKHDVSLSNEMKIYKEFKKKYGLERGAYPIVFIGNKFLIGKTAIEKNLENEIKECSKEGCECPSEEIFGITPHPPKLGETTPEKETTIKVPIFGELDTSKIALPLLTVIIGGLDSFNPCAFFVLFFLLSMLIYAQSRKRMLLIGGTFVFFSGFIYFLFMAAWLNLFLIIGQLMIITIIAGIIALIVALINIKDFFFFKKGISLVIPEKAKPKLFKRMRELLKATSIPSMLIGTIVLAIAANSYELLCTAGFPMVFTRILTLHTLSTVEYYLYLVLYNVVYVIPLIFIVFMFTITLGAKKLTEWQGRVLKLISGFMMLCLGLVLLIKPALLNNVFTSVALLAIALSIAGIIIFVTKKFGGGK